MHDGDKPPNSRWNRSEKTRGQQIKPTDNLASQLKREQVRAHKNTQFLYDTPYVYPLPNTHEFNNFKADIYFLRQHHRKPTTAPKRKGGWSHELTSYSWTKPALHHFPPAERAARLIYTLSIIVAKQLLVLQKPKTLLSIWSQ